MNTIAQDQSPSYDDVIARIAADPEEFWLDQAKKHVDWITEPTRAVDDANAPIYRWFPDGELNVCFNAVDRHVAAGRGDQAAIIYDSPVTDTIRTITYSDLLDEVSRFARALSDKGVVKGDRVIIYMPMVPEAAIAMLACARLGAIHSVVFGGFAPNELAVRIDDTSPKAVISTSCGVEKSRILEYKPMVDEAIDIAENKPEFTVIVQRDEHRCEMGENDLDYAELLENTPEGIDPVPVKATDELYVLYTSGTTGKPKGIVRDSGGYAVASAFSMPNIFGLNPGDTMFTASDVGWVVGHTYIVYAPLLAGVTSVLFEGK
ncbi:MAG: AMP-binding protein, partial [Brevibacterium aurantiacum]|nr:AMP-binding protein [Brevibacterium aurantiacum]